VVATGADGGAPSPLGPSTSIGSPNHGRLEGGVPLPWRAEGLVLNERRINPDSFYGTTEMIGAIERAAAAVAREMPGSTLVVNDIGFREGGDIPHHGSHRSGRDSDILFYLTDRRGEPVASRGVVIEPDGTGVDFKDLADPADDDHVKLDARRTWRFVRALVEDPEALVQRLFIAEHVRTMLLAEAARVRAPRFAVERAGDAMCQPSPPHDDHLHLRLFCTAEDMRGGCLDGYPMYPWRRRELATAGIPEPMMAGRPHKGPRDRTVAAAPEARPVLHRKVRELLERRKTWSGPVHAGRAWCN
jgi:penicillin-insensitive murein endopeptidase